jgi:hypothetical protein
VGRCRFIVMVVLAGCLVGRVTRGAEMVLYTEEVATSEGGAATRPVLLTETHEVRFRPPTGWHMELTSTNQTVMFYEPGMVAGIMMRLWTHEQGEGTEQLMAQWRERLEERLERSRVVQEFKSYSVNAVGLGFDLEQALSETTRAAFRIALIPFPGGAVEFELRSSAEQATNFHRVFRHLMGSFSAAVRPKPGRSEAAKGVSAARVAARGGGGDG